MRFLSFIFLFTIGPLVLAQDDSTIIHIKVSSSNLSEDLSVTSSKNDELMLLIYEYSEDVEMLGKPLLDANFRFNENQMEYSKEWKIKDQNEFIFFLIEQDSDNSIYQIDPVIRVYFKEIIECHRKRDYQGIEKYLGDEDLLGFASFLVPSNHQLNGVFKLDKFEYTITFQE